MSEKEIALHYIQQLNDELQDMVNHLCFNDCDFRGATTIVLNMLAMINK